MRPMKLIAACLFLLSGAAASPAAVASEGSAEVSPQHDLISSDGVSDELTKRKALMEDVHQHILARDFAWLDATEQSWRSNRSREVTGVWKLELFYNSMFLLGRLTPAPDCADNADPFLADWRRASPHSPAPFIATAQRLLDKGWCFRGSGYASGVDDAAWQPFRENVEAAYEMLASHKSVASADPQYYALMASIYVAQGRAENELRALLSEAVRKEPYYYRLYDNAFEYYEPQWFGDYKAEEALALFAVKQTRPMDRTSAFARVYWDAMLCGCLRPANAVNRPLLRQAMRDLADLYPNPWNLSHLARMACEIGDSDLARRYFAALPRGDDGKSGWADWSDVDVSSWRACRSTAGLQTS